MADSKLRRPVKRPPKRKTSASAISATAPRIRTVVRDSNFVRTVADTATAIFIGRDVELSLLTVSPTLKSVSLTASVANPVDTDHEYVYVETALVRMSPSAAAFLAYNTLFALIQSGAVDFEKVQRNIDDMRDQLPSALLRESD